MKTTMMLWMVMLAAVGACEAVGDPADCNAPSDCAEDQVCFIPDGDDVGYCIVACTSDDQCASNSCDTDTSLCDEIAPI